MITISVDRLGAPVASIRASTTGDHVKREKAVRSPPSLSILIHIDQVPSRQREHFQICSKLARRVPTNGPTIAISEPANGSARPAFGEFNNGSFYFSDQDRIETRAEIFQDVIGRIR